MVHLAYGRWSSTMCSSAARSGSICSFSRAAAMTGSHRLSSLG